jgi:hypothetical protein
MFPSNLSAFVSTNGNKGDEIREGKRNKKEGKREDRRLTTPARPPLEGSSLL